MPMFDGGGAGGPMGRFQDPGFMQRLMEMLGRLRGGGGDTTVQPPAEATPFAGDSGDPATGRSGMKPAQPPANPEYEAWLQMPGSGVRNFRNRVGSSPEDFARWQQRRDFRNAPPVRNATAQEPPQGGGIRQPDGSVAFGPDGGKRPSRPGDPYDQGNQFRNVTAREPMQGGDMGAGVQGDMKAINLDLRYNPATGRYEGRNENNEFDFEGGIDPRMSAIVGNMVPAGGFESYDAWNARMRSQNPDWGSAMDPNMIYPGQPGHPGGGYPVPRDGNQQTSFPGGFGSNTPQTMTMGPSGPVQGHNPYLIDIINRVGGSGPPFMRPPGGGAPQGGNPGMETMREEPMPIKQAIPPGVKAGKPKPNAAPPQPAGGVKNAAAPLRRKPPKGGRR